MKCYKVQLCSLPKILLAYDVAANNYSNVFPHEQNYIEISVLLGGNMVYEPLNGPREQFFPGEILTLLPDFCGKTYAEGGLNHHVTVGFCAQYKWQCFDTDRMEKQELFELLQEACREDVYLLPYRGATGESYPFLREDLMEMTRYFPGGSVADPANCKALLFQLLAKLSRTCAGELTSILHDYKPGSKVAYCRQIKEYIHGHYKDKLSLKKVAGEVNVSVNYMCRLFQEVEHCTVNEYLTRYRLKLAEALLCKVGLTVGEIAAAVGIEDEFYFRKLFRKRYGMKVSEYRQMRRSQLHEEAAR